MWVEVHAQRQDLWRKFYSMDHVNDVRTKLVRNVTHATLVRWVGRNTVPVSAVCGPKFTKLSKRARSNCGLRRRFPFDDFLCRSIRRNSRTSCEVLRNFPQILMFWGRQSSLGTAPNFWPMQIYKFGSPSNVCVKIWWQSTEWSRTRQRCANDSLLTSSTPHRL